MEGNRKLYSNLSEDRRKYEMGNCIDKCVGCKHAIPTEIPEKEGRQDSMWFTCLKYANPAAVWTRLLGCPMRTHSKSVGIEEKRNVDPLKASKQRARGIK